MRNFGEELAYWYFRLNGFFLLDNFVLHSDDLESYQNADVDIIGIRHPHAVEKIGMRDSHDVCEQLEGFVPDIDFKTVVVLSEVKSGDRRSREITLDRVSRIEYAIMRTGLFKPNQRNKVITELQTGKSCNEDSITVLKVLISHRYRSSNNDSFHHLSLQDVEGHILQKLKKYKNSKNPAKLFFPSTLMQYLIWKAQ